MKMFDNLIKILFILLYISLSYQSWHAINETIEKESIYISKIAESIRENWNGKSTPINHLKQQSYQELYFDQAIDIIYNHQNPGDCRNSKYIATLGYPSGFGSEIHVDGFSLGVAMELNRIFIPQRKRYESQGWQTPPSLCKDVNNLECYFLPWSNCPKSDIAMKISKQTKVRMFKISDEHRLIFKKTNRIPKEALIPYENESVIAILPGILVEDFRYIIPPQFNKILSNLLIDSKHHYYWWRAISAAYLMRLNQNTINHIKTHSLFHSLSNNDIRSNIKSGRCISMYIRHGDKAIEMKLVPYLNYIMTAKHIWYNYTIANNSKPLIIFGTETPKVFANVLTYSYLHNWKILFNPIQLYIYNKKGLNIFEFLTNDITNYISNHLSINLTNYSNRTNNHTKHKPKHQKPLNQHNHRQLQSIDIKVPQSFYEIAKFVDYEYLSMIINLYDFIKCDYFICTLASNYCRLIDEFRAFISVKPDAIFADLSIETCRSPPCIGPNHIDNFNW